MNNKKYIGILIIIVGLIAFIGLVYFMFFYDFSSKELTQGNKESAGEAPAGETPGQPLKQSVKTSPQRAVINIEERIQSDDKVTEEDLKRMAASFAERLGSYSNQSNYGNIRDLKIFMSAKMKNWADRFIEEETAKNSDSSIYYGVTTKAVSKQVNQFDDDLGRAEIVVGAQRREATGTISNATSFRQDVVISFVKENGAWMADNAVWQKR